MTDPRDITETPLFKKLLAYAREHLKQDADQFNAEYARLQSRDHGLVGCVLTCHLLIEHYLDEYLRAAYPTISRWQDMNLTFAKKLMMADSPGLRFWIDAIESFNTLRNKLAHSLEYVPSKRHLDLIGRPLNALLRADNKPPLVDPLATIQALAVWVCGSLSFRTREIEHYAEGKGLVGLNEWYSRGDDA